MRNLFFIGLIILFYSCDKKVGKLPVVEPVAEVFNCDSAKYSKDIQPILTAYCVNCHAATFQDFTNYNGTKVQVDNGNFAVYVLQTKLMPEGTSLTEEEYNKIKCWIDRGAPNN